MALPAALVLAYVLLGGLGAAMYNQALQFCLVVAGLLPVVLLGLKKIGGWSGLKAAVPASFLHEWSGTAHAGAHPMGIGAVGLVVGVGLVLGGGTWCADFRLLQTAMAAKDVESARRAPLIAAAVWVFVPFVLILPGLIAVGAAHAAHDDCDPQRKRRDLSRHHRCAAGGGSGAGAGSGKSRCATGKPVMGADGHAVLDYAMATPDVLLQFLPMGLLGLGLAALLACLMGGVAASLTAFSTVFTCDIYQAFLAKDASDKRLLAVGRWAAVGRHVACLRRGVRGDALQQPARRDAAGLRGGECAAVCGAAAGSFLEARDGARRLCGTDRGRSRRVCCTTDLRCRKARSRAFTADGLRCCTIPRARWRLGLGTAMFAFRVSLLVTAVVSAVHAGARQSRETQRAGVLARRRGRRRMGHGGSGRRRWPRRFCWRRLQ